MRKITLLLLSCVISGHAVSSEVFNTPTQNTIINTSQLGNAKDWNLTEIEWAKYQALMRGASGHYYRQLTPSQILGIQAETPDEMRHFAEISAKQEHDKLEKELRFNNAFHEAAARLYAAEPLIKPFDYARFTPISKKED